jgi:hypothetical protein
VIDFPLPDAEEIDFLISQLVLPEKLKLSVQFAVWAISYRLIGTALASVLDAVEVVRSPFLHLEHPHGQYRLSQPEL